MNAHKSGVPPSEPRDLPTGTPCANCGSVWGDHTGTLCPTGNVSHFAAVMAAPTLPEPHAYEVQRAEAGTDCSRAEFRVLAPRDPDSYEKVTRLYTEVQVRALLGANGLALPALPKPLTDPDENGEIRDDEGFSYMQGWNDCLKAAAGVPGTYKPEDKNHG